MNKVKIILFIFGLFVKFSTQQPDALLPYEQSLQKMNDEMTNFELKVAKKLTDFGAYVRVSSMNLKAVKLAPNLTNVYDATLITIRQLNTIKSFRTFLPITNYSTCDYVNIRKSFTELDMRKLNSIISDIEINATKIYESFNQITFNYATNLRTLAMNWTREVSVLNTIKQMMPTLNEYWKYLGILKTNLKNFGDFNSYLSSMTLNCTNSTSTFKDDGDKIEAKLVKCEQDLINLEKIAIQKIDAALMTVSASAPILRSITTQSNKKLSLQKMKNNLGKFSTVDDYPKVAWPHIPDATGMATGMATGTKTIDRKPMKLRAAREKKESYQNVWNNGKKNQTQVQSDRNDLESNQATRKKRSTDPVIDGILNATMDVFNQFTIYLQLINDSNVQVDVIIAEIVKEMSYPCGTFLPYDAVNDPLGPLIRGIDAGLHVDGTIAYMGYGLNSMDSDQKKCPGRFSFERKGIFLGRGARIILDTTNSHYLVRHPEMEFVPTNRTHMMTISGAIRINMGLRYPFFLGRAFNGSNVMLGKTHAGGGVYGFYFSTGSTELIRTTDYEVLACPCTKVDPGTAIPTVCPKPFRLYDQKCVYRKTGCRVSLPGYNQTAASSYCQANGMQLYSVLTDVDYDLLETLSGLGYPGSGGSLLVNGIQAANGTWFVYNPDAKPLFSGIKVNSVDGCLILDFGAVPSISFRALPCNASANFFCEFY